MKKPLLHVIFFIVFAITLTETGCKKEKQTPNTLPTLTTQDVMLDVTSTSAQSGGTITVIGTGIISANGVCYSSTSQTPTLADSKTSDPVVDYTFVSNLSGLTPGTTYYVRAYATNSAGTSYGSVVSFTTSTGISSVSGDVTTFAGSGIAGYADGLGTGAQFNGPGSIAVDAQGNVYVSDSFNSRIRKIAIDGTVTTVAGDGTPGYADGAAADARFYGPQGLAVDAQGNIFVADFGNNVIRKISTDGVVSTFAGNTTAGHVDGAATAAEFNGPYGIAFDKQGNLYVADNNNNMIRKVTSAGVVSTVAGTGAAGYVNATINSSTGVNAVFNHPGGVTVDASGNIYVADGGNSAIRLITPAGVVSTIAGGTVQSALVGNPIAISIDQQGNLFITDENGRAIELTSAKILYVLAGAPGVTGYADGSGAAVKFNAPQGIAVDTQGNIYIADSGNNRIRKMTVVDTE